MYEFVSKSQMTTNVSGISVYHLYWRDTRQSGSWNQNQAEDKVGETTDKRAMNNLY